MTRTLRKSASHLSCLMLVFLFACALTNRGGCIDVSTLPGVVPNVDTDEAARANAKAFQMAINKLGSQDSNSIGFDLHFPEGSWFIDKPLFFIGRNATMSGEGTAKSFLKARSTCKGITMVYQGWANVIESYEPTADIRPRLTEGQYYDGSVKPVKYGLRTVSANRKNYASFPGTPLQGGAAGPNVGQSMHITGMPNWTLDLGFSHNGAGEFADNGEFWCAGPMNQRHHNPVFGFYSVVDAKGCGSIRCNILRSDGTFIGLCNNVPGSPGYFRMAPGAKVRVSLQARTDADGNVHMTLWAGDAASVRLVAKATIDHPLTLASSDYGSITIGDFVDLSRGPGANAHDLTFFGCHLTQSARYDDTANAGEVQAIGGVGTLNDDFRFFADDPVRKDTVAFLPFGDNYSGSSTDSSSDLYLQGNLVTVQHGRAAGDNTQRSYGLLRYHIQHNDSFGSFQSIHDLSIWNSARDRDYNPWGIGICIGEGLYTNIYNMDIWGGYWGIGALSVPQNVYVYFVDNCSLRGGDAAYDSSGGDAGHNVCMSNLTIAKPGYTAINYLGGTPVLQDIKIGCGDGWPGAYTDYLIRTVIDVFTVGHYPAIERVVCDNKMQAYPKKAAFAIRSDTGLVLRDCSIDSLPATASFLELVPFKVVTEHVDFAVSNNKVSSVTGGKAFASYVLNRIDATVFGRIYGCTATTPVQKWVDTSQLANGDQENNVQTYHPDFSTSAPTTKSWTKDAHVAINPVTGVEYRCTASGDGAASTWKPIERADTTRGPAHDR